MSPSRYESWHSLLWLDKGRHGGKGAYQGAQNRVLHKVAASNHSEATPFLYQIAKAVGRIVRVFAADGHTAKQHEFRRQAKKFAERLWIDAPRLLGATVETLLAQPHYPYGLPNPTLCGDGRAVTPIEESMCAVSIAHAAY